MHQGPNHWSHLCLGVKGGRLFRICLLTPSQRGRVFRICLTVSKRSPSWKRGLLCGATKWLRIHWNYSLLKRPENVMNGLRMWLRALTSQEMILRSWTRTCKKNVRIYVVIALLFLKYADSIFFFFFFLKYFSLLACNICFPIQVIKHSLLKTLLLMMSLTSTHFWTTILLSLSCEMSQGSRTCERIDESMLALTESYAFAVLYAACSVALYVVWCIYYASGIWDILPSPTLFWWWWMCMM